MRSRSVTRVASRRSCDGARRPRRPPRAAPARPRRASRRSSRRRRRTIDPPVPAASRDAKAAGDVVARAPARGRGRAGRRCGASCTSSGATRQTGPRARRVRRTRYPRRRNAAREVGIGTSTAAGSPTAPTALRASAGASARGEAGAALLLERAEHPRRRRRRSASPLHTARSSAPHPPPTTRRCGTGAKRAHSPRTARRRARRSPRTRPAGRSAERLGERRREPRARIRRDGSPRDDCARGAAPAPTSAAHRWTDAAAPRTAGEEPSALRRALLRREHEDPRRRLLPVRAAPDVERAVVVPQPHGRDARCHRRSTPMPTGAAVVAAGPPTSCSTTSDASPSRESTPTVASSSHASADAGAADRCRSATARRAAAGTPSASRTIPATHTALRAPALTIAAIRVPSRETRHGRDLRSPRATRRRRRSRRRPAGRPSSAPGCARGTLHTTSNGSIVGSTSPSRVSSRSDDPSAPWPRDRPVRRAAARPSRARRATWIDAGDTVLDRPR